MIKVKNCKKSFEQESVLKGVNLHIEKGSVYGLLGANGTGKTTLLNILAGIYTADEGEILIDDTSVYENVKTKKKIVYIPDSLYFFGRRTLKELAKYYKYMYGKFDNDLYIQLIKVFELNEKKQLASFSKGMKKQAVFIVSICTQPEVFLMDELIDGVDPIKRRLVWSVLMKEVALRNMTVVIASHNIKELEGVCNEIGIIHNGVCALQVNVEEIREEQNSSLEEFVIEQMGGITDEVKEYLNQ